MTVFFQFVNLHFFSNSIKLRSFFVILFKNCNVLLRILVNFILLFCFLVIPIIHFFLFCNLFTQIFLLTNQTFLLFYALGRHLTASERYSFLTSANFPASTIDAKFGSNGIFAITGIFNSAPISSALLSPNT